MKKILALIRLTKLGPSRWLTRRNEHSELGSGHANYIKLLKNKRKTYVLATLYLHKQYDSLARPQSLLFGEPRKGAGSHRVYKTPWHGDPRINIQNHKGKAKAYQVKQVLLALEKLEVNHGITK